MLGAGQEGMMMTVKKTENSFQSLDFLYKIKTINVDTKVKFANYRPANFFNYHYIFCSIQPLYHFTLISLVL